jgi:hypothetical protein
MLNIPDMSFCKQTLSYHRLSILYNLTPSSDQHLLSVCRTAEACRNSFAYLPTPRSSTTQALNTTMTCNTDPTTYTSSQLSCNVNSPTLRSLFPLQSLLTITRTVDDKNVAWANASSGNLGMDLGGSGAAFAQLWYDGVEQVGRYSRSPLTANISS